MKSRTSARDRHITKTQQRLLREKGMRFRAHPHSRWRTHTVGMLSARVGVTWVPLAQVIFPMTLARLECHLASAGEVRQKAATTWRVDSS